MKLLENFCFLFEFLLVEPLIFIILVALEEQEVHVGLEL